jgi:signal transduction histidine kinase
MKRPYRVAAILLASGIFLVDTLTPLEGAVAVLYVVVVLLAAQTGRRTDIIVAGAGSVLLTLAAYVLSHGLTHVGAPTMRLFVSLAAVGITTLLALQNQRATKTLVRSERRFRRMFDASRMGILLQDWGGVRAELAALGTVDPASVSQRIAADPGLVRRARALARIVEVNPAFRAIAGTGSAEGRLASVDDLLDESDLAFAAALTAFARGDAFHEGEAEIVRPDGRRVPVLFAITFPTVEDDGNVLVFVVDNSERKRAQDALQLAQAELAHAARVATLGELTASIAHEVNQPLMAVVTSGEAGMRWLRRTTPDLHEVETALTRVVSEAHRASAILGRIRAFLTKAPPPPAPISVGVIIEEAIQLVQRELSGGQVALQVDVTPGLPLIVGDRIQLQQVLVNLMINAGQAMAERPHPRLLSIEAAPFDAGHLVITLSDTGPGIAADHLARLFDPFFTTKPDGMGMGLAISRTTVEAHGGRLSVDSAPGQGATFRLTLPLSQEQVGP